MNATLPLAALSLARFAVTASGGLITADELTSTPDPASRPMAVSHAVAVATSPVGQRGHACVIATEFAAGVGSRDSASLAPRQPATSSAIVPGFNFRSASCVSVSGAQGEPWSLRCAGSSVGGTDTLSIHFTAPLYSLPSRASLPEQEPIPQWLFVGHAPAAAEELLLPVREHE